MSGEYEQFRHPSTNRAVVEIDALLFVADPTLREMDEVERLCRRWMRQIEVLRKQSGGDLI